MVVGGHVVEATRVDGVIDSIADLFRAVETRRAQDAASAQLTATEYRALIRAASVGELTPKRLADSMGLSTAAITAVIDRLAARELVERVSNPVDKRSVVLEPTEAGRAVIDRTYGALAILVADAIADVPEDCIDEVTAVLSKITLALRAV